MVEPGLKHVEVDIASERDRLPAAACVAGLDESEEGRIAGLAGMPGAKEAIRPDDAEAHGVLEQAGDACRCNVVWGDAEQAGVGGDHESSVGRIAAQPVDMDDAGVRRSGRRRILRGAPTAREDWDQEPDRCEPPHASTKSRAARPKSGGATDSVTAWPRDLFRGL